ncbi:MAG: aminopeptidase [Candidatus Cloacimonetes bacterium]|nr:aminopeptidase [Candidatus Cloacimonadota bacterium]
MKKIEELIKKLTYDRRNFWEKADSKEIKKSFEFAEDYKEFLSICKTERETIDYYENILGKKGFKDIDKQESSTKLYRTSHNKNAAIAYIGKKPVADGVNLIVAHVDTPRVDIKQNPLYEDGTTKLGILKTHYYGGVKKYQWMSTPLAIHGIFINEKGEVIKLTIGEDENDPVFIMPDLLPHLARKEQYTKKIGEAISAANMKVVFNCMPYIEEDEKIKEAVKLNALYFLNQKYGFIEEDFLSAELQLVPAGKARDAGLDRSMILGYGQDDRVCTYTAAEAIFDLIDNDFERTAIVYLADKEETGSDGNTGAKSIFIIDFIADLLKANGESNDSNTLRKTLMKSQILSADVNAAINPNYPTVHEKQNAVHLGYGVSVTKYTGAGGKGGTNDANAEFSAKIKTIFNDENVFWQTGALGKVDEGGGGTIAKFMAEHGAEVIDCGPGVLGMHSLYELTSKADVYSSYKAYKTFFLKG